MLLLDLLQYIISSVTLLQSLLRVQVLLTMVFIVVLDVTDAPTSLLIVVAKVDSLPRPGTALLTMHGCGT